MPVTRDSKRDFWNDRASMGALAGTNDFMLAALEHELIQNSVRDGARILDAGSGAGMLLTDLATTKGCSGLGIDFAPKMVEAANMLAKERGVQDRVSFVSGDLLDLGVIHQQFDYAISKRSLCNLADINEQFQAFQNIMSLVRIGGFYIMIEDSQDGLERVNALRNMLALPPIEAPWHNVFLAEKEVSSWTRPGWRLEKEVPFASTYYFLSRVVYARLAADRDEELRYDSDINLLSLTLPPIGDFCPTRLWLWKKTGTDAEQR